MQSLINRLSTYKGTTWVQEIVSQIESLHMENGTEWKSTNIEDRFPFLEFVYPGVNEIAKMKSPRFIKTHLPYQLLSPSITNGSKVGIFFFLY